MFSILINIKIIKFLYVGMFVMELWKISFVYQYRIIKLICSNTVHSFRYLYLFAKNMFTVFYCVGIVT